MGEDARWVCHTCKTVYSRGGRPIFQSIPRELTVGEIDAYKEQIRAFHEVFRLEDEDTMISFLDDLRRWASRHEGHNVHIGSDYSTDMMDLEEYHDETVDGEVSDLTEFEAQVQAMKGLEERTINKIRDVLMSRKLSGTARAFNSAARELYRRFSVKDL